MQKNKSEKTKEEKVSFLTHIKEKFYSLWSKNKQNKKKRGLTEDQLRRLKESEEQNKNRPDDYKHETFGGDWEEYWKSLSQEEKDDIEFKDIDNMPLLRRYNKKDGR